MSFCTAEESSQLRPGYRTLRIKAVAVQTVGQPQTYCGINIPPLVGGNLRIICEPGRFARYSSGFRIFAECPDQELCYPFAAGFTFSPGGFQIIRSHFYRFVQQPLLESKHDIRLIIVGYFEIRWKDYIGIALHIALQLHETQRHQHRFLLGNGIPRTE
ncbi:hypothetical protein D3C74_330800 [compost metagenome]